MKSGVVKRSVNLNGHKTSVSLEQDFWQALRELAAERGLSVAQLVADIDRNRDTGNLSSCIRVFVFADARGKLKALQDGSQPAVRGSLAGHTGHEPVVTQIQPARMAFD